MEKGMEKIDTLLEKPCYIIDFLPERVEPDNGAQYFDVEHYLLGSDKHIGLKDKFVAVILKLMCYYHVAILWNGWVDRPSPKMIEEDALLVFDWDCLNLAVYNPSEKSQPIMEKIAFSEGLFWRKAPN